jgi:hypothetical protein
LGVGLGLVIGPNVKRLLFTKMAKDAIPDGGGLAAGVNFLSKKENISAGFKAARKWTEQVIQLVRTAAEPNPWKDASDEEIAGEVLRRLEERERAGRP